MDNSEAVLAVEISRRDMLYRDCAVCADGEYLYISGGDAVVCSSCGDTVPRWMTKRELLAHAIAKGDL